MAQEEIEQSKNEESVDSKEKSGEKKKSSAGSNLKYFVNFLYSFVVTVIVIIAVGFILLKVTNVSAFSVESGSMEPKYPTNSVVLVKEDVDPSTIKVGDVITYVFNEQGMLVTHRVVKVDTTNEKFTTKGDANNENDPAQVLWGNMVGKVVFCIPHIGKAVSFVSDTANRKYIIAAIVVIGVISIGSDIIERRISKRKAAKANANTDAKKGGE